MWLVPEVLWCLITCAIIKTVVKVQMFYSVPDPLRYCLRECYYLQLKVTISGSPGFLPSQHQLYVRYFGR